MGLYVAHPRAAIATVVQPRRVTRPLTEPEWYVTSSEIPQVCPKCSGRVYSRLTLSRHGKAVEYHCVCGWSKTVQVQEGF